MKHKYNIGDFVKLERVRTSDHRLIENKIGFIIEKKESIDYIDYADPTTAYAFESYKLIVAGIEGTCFAYEEYIAEKLE